MWQILILEKYFVKIAYSKMYVMFFVSTCKTISNCNYGYDLNSLEDECKKSHKFKFINYKSKNNQTYNITNFFFKFHFTFQVFLLVHFFNIFIFWRFL